MIIDVVHESWDGWHKFTSPQVPGLYVVSQEADLEASYNDVPRVIEALVEADFGRKVTVTFVQSFGEYAETLPAAFKRKISHYEVEQRAAA